MRGMKETEQMPDRNRQVKKVNILQLLLLANIFQNVCVSFRQFSDRLYTAIRQDNQTEAPDALEEEYVRSKIWGVAKYLKLIYLQKVACFKERFSSSFDGTSLY